MTKITLDNHTQHHILRALRLAVQEDKNEMTRKQADYALRLLNQEIEKIFVGRSYEDYFAEQCAKYGCD